MLRNIGSLNVRNYINIYDKDLLAHKFEGTYDFDKVLKTHKLEVT